CLAGDGSALRGFKQSQIGECRFKKLIVHRRRSLKLAGLECVAGDPPLKDGVGRMKHRIDARNGWRAGADRKGAETAEGRSATGCNVVALDLLNATFVLVVV